jgi:hypothetical protein
LTFKIAFSLRILKEKCIKIIVSIDMLREVVGQLMAGDAAGLALQPFAIQRIGLKKCLW